MRTYVQERERESARERECERESVRERERERESAPAVGFLNVFNDVSV